MRRRALPVLAVLAASALGCGEAPAPIPRLSTVDAPIIGGTKDFTHDAVVAVLGNNWACTGTIIATDGNIGYVLTAAHCVDDGPPVQVRQGADYQFADAVYPVLNYASHPQYSLPVFDFAMVQIGSASGAPTIPAMTPADDNLSSGTVLRHVGYGKTSYPNGDTTERHAIDNTIAGVQAATFFYNQPNGGPCKGDSGGPGLTTGGTERVAGVVSAGDEGCAQSGTSGRVSAAYDSFIEPFLQNTTPGALTCDQCTQWAATVGGPCGGNVSACDADAECSALLDCFDGCNGSNFCLNSCVNSHPSGYQMYLGIFDCVCDTACTAECDGEPICTQQGGTTAAATAATSAVTSSTTTVTTAGVGGGAPTTAGSGAGGPVDDAWVAGSVPDQDYQGVIQQSCSAALGHTRRDPRPLVLFGLAGMFAAWRRSRRKRPRR